MKKIIFGAIMLLAAPILGEGGPVEAVADGLSTPPIVASPAPRKKVRRPRRPRRAAVPVAVATTTVVLRDDDRLLVLAPHPDDDILCCGGLIQEAVDRGLPLRVVYFTYGDNYEWAFMAYKKHPVIRRKAMQNMGLLRHDEAVAGMGVLGVSSGSLSFLGYPDYGTLKIWNSRWDGRPPYRSMLTRVSKVPYANAYRPGAAYKGEEIVKDLTSLLREFRPTKIFVSHPGDQHPDHRALPLFLHVALWDLGPDFAPAVYPYLVHLRRWPSPPGHRPDQPLAPPAAFRALAQWETFPVDAGRREAKRRALERHRTQFAYDRNYLLSFIRTNELFGDFPILDLDRKGLPPPEDSDRERAKFVGVETKTVSVQNGKLVVTVSYQRPLGNRTGVQVFAFGYRPGVPFERMPKLRIDFGALRHRVFDQGRELPWKSIEVDREPRRITLWIPLELMGEPDRILLSSRSLFVSLPLDWATWHLVELGRRTSDPSERKESDGQNR